MQLEWILWEVVSSAIFENNIINNDLNGNVPIVTELSSYDKFCYI